MAEPNQLNEKDSNKFWVVVKINTSNTGGLSSIRNGALIFSSSEKAQICAINLTKTTGEKCYIMESIFSVETKTIIEKLSGPLISSTSYKTQVLPNQKTWSEDRARESDWRHSAKKPKENLGLIPHYNRRFKTECTAEESHTVPSLPSSTNEDAF